MTSLRRALLTFGCTILTIILIGVGFTTPSAELAVAHSDTLAATSTVPAPTPVDTAPTPAPSNCETRIDGLEKRLDDLGTLVEVQSNAFDATVSRIESNLNLLLTILAVASFLVAILGFGVVRVWIRKLVEDQMQIMTSQEIARVSQEEIDRVREEWEPKFAALYEEYRRSVRK